MVGQEPSAQNIMLAGLGIRAYLMPADLFKLYLGARAVLDFTQSGGISGWSPVDFGVRGEFGLQVDIVRYIGLYIEIGANVTFIRAFGISPDVTGGVQIRFP
jgi:hypothetical protein